MECLSWRRKSTTRSEILQSRMRKRLAKSCSHAGAPRRGPPRPRQRGHVQATQGVRKARPSVLSPGVLREPLGLGELCFPSSCPLSCFFSFFPSLFLPPSFFLSFLRSFFQEQLFSSLSFPPTNGVHHILEPEFRSPGSWPRVWCDSQFIMKMGPLAPDKGMAL